ncbi:hypothetical protein [Actinocrispum wychmicini]|uniref:Uncharacterized protein n=1 Tax=Actinocrispum wychmicini TaxID=1213861 RepID=A0A4R2IVM2_9PSEU|nr:hypothetical protein [Actinocrispum wychmicini]TCO49693.1 hypothetical protein EV192_11459 [Actinocrispum wychmicini]
MPSPHDCSPPQHDDRVACGSLCTGHRDVDLASHTARTAIRLQVTADAVGWVGGRRIVVVPDGRREPGAVSPHMVIPTSRNALDIPAE